MALHHLSEDLAIVIHGDGDTHLISPETVEELRTLLTSETHFALEVALTPAMTEIVHLILATMIGGAQALRIIVIAQTLTSIDLDGVTTGNETLQGPQGLTLAMAPLALGTPIDHLQLPSRNDLPVPPVPIGQGVQLMRI